MIQQPGVCQLTCFTHCLTEVGAEVLVLSLPLDVGMAKRSPRPKQPCLRPSNLLHSFSVFSLLPSISSTKQIRPLTLLNISAALLYPAQRGLMPCAKDKSSSVDKFPFHAAAFVCRSTYKKPCIMSCYVVCKSVSVMKTLFCVDQSHERLLFH